MQNLCTTFWVPSVHGVWILRAQFAWHIQWNLLHGGAFPPGPSERALQDCIVQFQHFSAKTTQSSDPVKNSFHFGQLINMMVPIPTKHAHFMAKEPEPLNNDLFGEVK